MSIHEYVVRERDGLWGVWLGDRLISGQPSQMEARALPKRSQAPPRPEASQRKSWSAISTAVRSSSGRCSRSSRRRRRRRKKPAGAGAQRSSRQGLGRDLEAAPPGRRTCQDGPVVGVRGHRQPRNWRRYRWINSSSEASASGPTRFGPMPWRTRRRSAANDRRSWSAPWTG